jgi:uncharacterized membrane protein YfcA
MRSITLLLATLCIAAAPQRALASAGGGKCAAANKYMCPYLSKSCNETVYVSDCLNCKGFFSTDNHDDVCFDRKLLNGKDNPPGGYLWRDILGLIVWFVAAGVATACGEGGGGIYVPLGMLLLNFAPKPSSGLSQASIFGASLGGLLLNSRNRHPFTTKVSNNDQMESIPFDDQVNTDQVTYYARPLIDFDMALFLAPMEMAGAVLGVLIQRILPNWLYLALASVILGFTAYKTFEKFHDAHHKEVVDREAILAEASEASKVLLENNVENPGEMIAEQRTSQAITLSSDARQDTMEDSDEEREQEHASVGPTEDVGTTEAEKAERRRYWLECDARQFPSEKLFGLLILWIGLVLLTFLKGGKGVDSIIGITCASPWYAVLIVIQFAWTMGISAYFGYSLMKQTEDKKACDYPRHPQDALWGFQQVRFYSFFTFVAGIVAGLIGIGGGMVLGPLMLVMGIHPRVSSATTATMIVLTSSSVAVLMVTAGLVPWEYAVTFFSVCFVGAYVGKTQIDGYIKKTGRASIIIFLLATIIVLAIIGCVVIVLTQLAAANWCFDGFNKFCTVSAYNHEGDLCPVDRMLSGDLFQY